MNEELVLLCFHRQRCNHTHGLELPIWLYSSDSGGFARTNQILYWTVEVRRSLHMRLGLPIDRPLLRISNALYFTVDGVKSKEMQKGNYLLAQTTPHYLCSRIKTLCLTAGQQFLVLSGPSLLKDVHIGIPSSGGEMLINFSFYCLVSLGSFIQTKC